MKKLALLSIFASSAIFAADNAKIVEYFKTQVPDHINVEVTQSKKVDSPKGYELVSIKISDGSRSQDVSMFYKDGFLFPDIIDLKNKNSYIKDIEEKQKADMLKITYKDEKSKNIISLGNDSKKETLVIFSDPECPWCGKELEKIEERLKTNNIKMILTPVHNESALKKSHLIYKEVAKAKTDAEKIKIIRKYYDKGVDISKENISKEEIAAIDELRNRYFRAGLQGVPFVIEEAKLK